MTTRVNNRLIIIGAALLLCLPLFAIIAGICAYSFPRQYYSHATVEFRSSNPATFLQAFGEAAQPYRGAAEVREVRNSNLWEIGVYDSNPQQAAERSNLIAVAVQQKLNDAARSDVSSTNPLAIQLRMPAVKIWERAEPTLAPAKPNARVIIFLGAGVGLLPAFAGVVLLVVAFVTRPSRVQSQVAQQNAPSA
jgi:hypothetical protein